MSFPKRSETEKVIKGYCTKYALTVGIYTVKVRREDGSKYVYAYEDGYMYQLVYGKTFFESRSAAESAAIAMAKKRLASLRKESERLQALTVGPRWRK